MNLEQELARKKEKLRLLEDPNTIYQFGLLAFDGDGVEQDYVEAASWFRIAGKQGHSKAQHNLGLVYEKGLGVPQDYAQALEWYFKAATQGNAGSQNNLGCLYESGCGVPQDYAEAVKWYLKAAEHGDVNSQFNIGMAYLNGRGVPQDDAEATSWFRKAAEQGLATAQYHLGLMLGIGRGVQKDLQHAIRWFQLAAAQGHEKAQEMADELIIERDEISNAGGMTKIKQGQIEEGNFDVNKAKKLGYDDYDEEASKEALEKAFKIIREDIEKEIEMNGTQSKEELDIEFEDLVSKLKARLKNSLLVK